MLDRGSKVGGAASAGLMLCCVHACLPLLSSAAGRPSLREAMTPAATTAAPPATVQLLMGSPPSSRKANARDQSGVVLKMTCASAGGTTDWPCVMSGWVGGEGAGTRGECAGRQGSHCAVLAVLCLWQRLQQALTRRIATSRPPAQTAFLHADLSAAHPLLPHLGVQESGQCAGAQRAPNHDGPGQRVGVAGPQVGKRGALSGQSRRRHAKRAQGDACRGVVGAAVGR